jgi:hypothetical protein
MTSTLDIAVLHNGRMGSEISTDVLQNIFANSPDYSPLTVDPEIFKVRIATKGASYFPSGFISIRLQ